MAYTLQIFLISLLSFILSLFASLLPLLTRPVFLRHCHTLSAGFLLSAALIHLLPPAHTAVSTVFPHYPLDGVIAVATFSILLVINNLPGSTKAAHDHVTVTGLVLPLTLCLHAALDAFAILFSVTTASTFVVVCVAVLTHKTIAAVTLSISLLQQRSRGVVITFALVFSSMTPLVLTIASFLINPDAEEQKHVSIVQPLLTCVTAAVFLYMAFVQLYQSNTDYESLYGTVGDDSDDGRLQMSEHDGGGSDGLIRKALFIAAVLIMSALALFL